MQQPIGKGNQTEDHSRYSKDGDADRSPNGKLDQFLSRVVDVVMSIPSLIFSLLLLSIFGTNTVTLIIVIAIIYAPRVFRLARSVGGNVVVMDYIEAAKLRGEGTWYLIRKEILPNSSAPLIAEFGLEFCFVFLLIAGLSFLGLGIQPPTADWGSMVRENATLISFGEITPLIPAGAIALLTVAVNFPARRRPVRQRQEQPESARHLHPRHGGS